MHCIIGVVIMASISGILAGFVMNANQSKYETTMQNYGFSQGDIGKLMGVVGQIDGNVHDAISYSDKKAASNAADAIDDMIQPDEQLYDLH